eukprot:1159701-Pelagomonas_calceolata.AAC.3
MATVWMIFICAAQAAAGTKGCGKSMVIGSWCHAEEVSKAGIACIFAAWIAAGRAGWQKHGQPPAAAMQRRSTQTCLH